MLRRKRRKLEQEEWMADIQLCVENTAYLLDQLADTLGYEWGEVPTEDPFVLSQVDPQFRSLATEWTWVKKKPVKKGKK